jgi:CheY-like chemotaxis protein
VLNEISFESAPPQEAPDLMPRPIHLLLVEDNEMDIKIFKRALLKTGISYPLTAAHDGIEALAILRGNGETMPLARPCVVLLDLNMPRMNGHEFLDEMRADPALNNLVVFVLTTSDAPRDKAEAYKHHVAGYILKSISGPSVGEILKMIDQFARVVELPS